MGKGQTIRWAVWSLLVVLTVTVVSGAAVFGAMLVVYLLNRGYIEACQTVLGELEFQHKILVLFWQGDPIAFAISLICGLLIALFVWKQANY
jgi:choline-glycine betaine transporter